MVPGIVAHQSSLEGAKLMMSRTRLAPSARP